MNPLFSALPSIARTYGYMRIAEQLPGLAKILIRFEKYLFVIEQTADIADHNIIVNAGCPCS